MITISESQLDQIEYLIAQSIQGNHVLFDTETLRKSFRSHSEKTKDVGKDVERLLALPTLAEKRAYLSQLGPGTLKQVVLSYFQIVESSLKNKEVRH